MDDFLTEVSHVLEISQKSLENDYYMVDIPGLVEKKRNERAAEYFMQLQLLIASNNRSLPDEGFENMVRNLTKNLEGEETKQETNKLDRQALETLRFMTNQGANRTGG